jgi:16S rRNA (adenine1518-N6/adenine1519-N6)-dimethyltransferase
LDLKPDEMVIEIGPGQGVLTEKLIATNAQIFSVEIDTELLPILSGKFSGFKNFNLINSDIMQLDIESKGPKHYKVCGSLPYNISKNIISKFLLTKNKPEDMVFIIQKEVAEDYSATSPKSSFLSNFAQAYSDVMYKDTIPRTDFYPTPEVNGGIIVFTNIKEKLSDPEKLIKFIKIGYSQPRKKLSANISSMFVNKQKAEEALISLGLKDTVRPSELTFDDWIKLRNLVLSKHD